jgi:phosphoribosylformylglycinamidine synthase
MTRIAVVEFPGTNCMTETLDALRAAGARPELLRWTAPARACRDFSGFVIAGGFSYEDRVRAGVVAAKHPLLDGIAEAAADGKPVLGVCNGAQILVEAGLVPGHPPGEVQVALAQNSARGWRGYICEWVHVRAEAGSGFLRELDRGTVLPLPVGHGEGRFTGGPDLFEELETRGHIGLRYVRADGTRAEEFPENPNGSAHDAAALCDLTGNVVALMPHPERAAWLYQVPESLPGPWGLARRAAAGDGRRLRGAGPGLGVYKCLVRAAGGREA